MEKEEDKGEEYQGQGKEEEEGERAPLICASEPAPRIISDEAAL